VKGEELLTVLGSVFIRRRGKAKERKSERVRDYKTEIAAKNRECVVSKREGEGIRYEQGKPFLGRHEL